MSVFRPYFSLGDTPLFDCVICQRKAFGWPEGFSSRFVSKSNHIPPVCMSCEDGAGMVSGYNHHRRSIPRVTHGAFKDRRIASQIAALAEAIEIEANSQMYKWGRHAT